MSSLGKRLITTFTAVPLLFCIIIFLPFRNHLAFSIVVILASLIGSHEMLNMAFPLQSDGKREKPLIPFWLPCLIPAAQWIEISFAPSSDVVEIVLLALLLAAFIVEIFRGARDNFTGTLTRVSHTTLLIVYPSFFASFLIRLFIFEHATYYLVMMFLLVFSNDVFAYVFGMWLGKNNRGVFKVSPNKSIAGFIGGMASCVVFSIATVVLIPVLSADIGLLEASIFGVAISITANAGDLIESAFKRSAGLKDSGTIIPGRGGLLDSIDSIIVSAPAFLLLLSQWVV